MYYNPNMISKRICRSKSAIEHCGLLIRGPLVVSTLQLAGKKATGEVRVTHIYI